jgi:hypothetical protein
MLPRRILQIIPADGWLAVYNHSVEDVEDLRTRPLVCWALVEDETGTRVVGLDADHVAGTGDASRFVGYSRVGESLARFTKP